MRDSFGRQITYLRLSVTDRCNLRCSYCVGDTFDLVPKESLLTIEELDRLCSAFIRMGVRKIRLTGGEPLVRAGLVDLAAGLGREVRAGRLDEWTLTTNGTRLSRFAEPLAAAGLRRVNISLDTLSASVFRAITRVGQFDAVMQGIEAAKQAGLKVKINAVVQRGVNEDGLDALVEWCGRQGFDLTLIEAMPVGDSGLEYDPMGPLSLDEVKARLSRQWTFVPDDYRSGGPADYFHIAETGGRIGFIAATSHNFCDRCNRVRVSATGRLYSCLGHEGGVDLLASVRGRESDQALEEAIRQAIADKPKGHGFAGAGDGLGPSFVARGMNVTGG